MRVRVVIQRISWCFSDCNNTEKNGKSLTTISYTTGYCSIGSTVYDMHAYAVIGANDSARRAFIFNPWGTGYPLLKCNMSEVRNNFGFIIYEE